jgi:hypothetical protein
MMTFASVEAQLANLPSRKRQMLGHEVVRP